MRSLCRGRVAGMWVAMRRASEVGLMDYNSPFFVAAKISSNRLLHNDAQELLRHSRRDTVGLEKFNSDSHVRHRERLDALYPMVI